MHPDFAGHARAALDAVFAHLGQWVAVHSAARGRHECRALLAGEDRETEFGAATLISPGAVLEFRAKDAPARGDAVALLDGPGGAETERRVVTAEPQATDALRLTVRVATAPE